MHLTIDTDACVAMLSLCVAWIYELVEAYRRAVHIKAAGSPNTDADTLD